MLLKLFQRKHTFAFPIKEVFIYGYKINGMGWGIGYTAKIKYVSTTAPSKTLEFR